jgi:hypothetical protein
MKEMKETAPVLRFDCACNGCRNYPTRPAEIWHESQIPNKEREGYFFTRDTMKAFSSRISDFKEIGISVSGIGSLMVIVSSRYGIEGAKRYYEVLTMCPFGIVSRDWTTDTEEPLAKYPTLAKARKSARWTGNAPRPLCSCHGCQLDVAGRI